MPSVKDVGKESQANQAIGGVPTIHYFDLASQGRGQVVRLLFEDAGIAYKDVRYSYDEFPDFKKGQLQQLNPMPTLPVLELNGRILTQSYAIIRHFARLLGAYDGTTEEEKYWADAMCDIAIDWRTRFVDALISPDTATVFPPYRENIRPQFLHGINRQLSQHPASKSGPFVIGQTMTYADLVIYQVAHDEGLTRNNRAGLQQYQRLVQLVDAVEARPGVLEFLKSDRYLG